MPIPTAHNEAKLGDIAKTVIMPGDPLRAKFIAESYLDDVNCFNKVRGMLGYTGFYKDKRISVMGHGMGIPSIGIYTHELYNFYDVDNIIRVGSAGGIGSNVRLRDIIIAMGASTNSSFAKQFNLPGVFAPIADFALLEKAVLKARDMELPFKVGNVLTSDTFYDDSNSLKAWDKMGLLAVEMEVAALYMNAARFGKSALSILTISDLPFTGEACSSEERQNTFTQMIELALDIS